MKIENTIIAITFVTLILIIAIIFFVIFQQRRFISIEREKRILEINQEKIFSEAIIMSQEIERKNIGEKLHEDVAPLLFLSLMDINSLLEINNFAYYKQLQPTSINLLDAINKIRNISHLIHPAAINSFGFIHGILDFSSIINKSQGCKMSINRINDELSLDKFRQIMLFRIVQELTMNSIIHGSAKKINVNIEDNKSNISIIISHNGMMYSNEDYKINLRQNGSLGLKNIQQRLDLLEGKLSFGSNDIKTMQIITLIIPN